MRLGIICLYQWLSKYIFNLLDFEISASRSFKMTSPSQLTAQWGTNTEKHINETHHPSNVNPNTAHVESAVRNRGKPDRNNVSRRDYHNAVGRLGSDDDDQTIRSRTTLNQARTTKSEHERRRLRRHLKRKSRIPGHVQSRDGNQGATTSPRWSSPPTKRRVDEAFQAFFFFFFFLVVLAAPPQET
jgi:hypothetical protein